MNSRPSRRYQAMEIEGLSGPRLLVFVYSHLLAALRQGHRAIGLEDHEARSTALCRARDLVYELVYALDHEAGGPLAHDLARLYHFYIREIGAVDFCPDAARLTTLIEMVVTLQEAWQAAAGQLADHSVPVGVDG